MIRKIFFLTSFISEALYEL